MAETSSRTPVVDRLLHQVDQHHPLLLPLLTLLIVAVIVGLPIAAVITA